VTSAVCSILGPFLSLFRRYSPSTSTTKRPAPAVTTATAGTDAGPSTSGDAAFASGSATVASDSAIVASGSMNGVPEELPEAYRVGEWLTAVSPRKAPYHPQMGDHCLYFRLGHQRYFEAVAEKDVYKINARDKPWELLQLY
ncbi:jg26631, partial [Pararge aegeria aegeria]